MKTKLLNKITVSSLSDGFRYKSLNFQVKWKPVKALFHTQRIWGTGTHVQTCGNDTDPFVLSVVDRHHRSSVSLDGKDKYRFVYVWGKARNETVNIKIQYQWG